MNPTPMVWTPQIHCKCSLPLEAGANCGLGFLSRHNMRYRSYKKLVLWLPHVQKLLESGVEGKDLNSAFSKVGRCMTIKLYLMNTLYSSLIGVPMQPGPMMPLG